MKKYFLLTLITLLIIILSACSQTENNEESVSVTETKLPQPTATKPLPTNTQAAPTSTPIIVPTPTPEELGVCSPLEGETMETLLSILSKGMDIPPFGQDTGHHGVDFSYYRRGDRESIQGVEVYAALEGTTVLTLDNNYPYGYAIMIETPLERFPEIWQQALLAGYLPVPEDPDYRLYCPAVTPPQVTGDYSVYHLYAHLETKPNYNPGDPIPCGGLIGTVGNSGYSSNPHLHFETRLGPSGASFTTMAHYQTSVTEEQMSNYCLWRLSGYYQLFDPFQMMGLTP